jgi:hypothetical protein
MGDWVDVQFVVRVAVENVFPNCPRHIHTYQLVERSTFVPRSGCTVPVPAPLLLSPSPAHSSSIPVGHVRQE